jgi:hypothetical protein
MKKNASAVASVSDVPTIDQKTLKDSIDRLKERFHAAQCDYLRRTGTTFDIGIVNYPSESWTTSDKEQIKRAAFTFGTCQWVGLITPDSRMAWSAERIQETGTVDLKRWDTLIRDADRLIELMPSGSSSRFLQMLFSKAAESPATLYPSNVKPRVWNVSSAFKALRINPDQDLMLVIQDAHSAADSLIDLLFNDVFNDASQVANIRAPVSFLDLKLKGNALTRLGKKFVQSLSPTEMKLVEAMILGGNKGITWDEASEIHCGDSKEALRSCKRTLKDKLSVLDIKIVDRHWKMINDHGT